MKPTPEQLAALPERTRRVVELRLEGLAVAQVGRHPDIDLTIEVVREILDAASIVLGQALRPGGIPRWISREALDHAAECARTDRRDAFELWRLRWGGTADQGRRALRFARLAFGIRSKFGDPSTDGRTASAFADLDEQPRCPRCHLLGHDAESCDLPGAAYYAVHRRPINVNA